MAKIHTTLTFDNDIMKKAKRLNLNVSGLLNDYLRTVIAQKNGDSEGINIELERLKRAKIMEKMADLAEKLQISEQNIRIFEKKQQENIEKELEKEKERIESSKKCLNCGKIMEEKAKKTEFKAGYVCRHCFLSASGEDVKRWNQKK